MAAKEPAKSLPAAIWAGGLILLILYLGGIAWLIWRGWDASLGGKAGETPNEWSRYKDAAEMLGGVVTAAVAALGGFLAQEPAKRRMAGDVRLVGRELRRRMERDFPATDHKGFASQRRAVNDALPEPVARVLDDYGV